MPGTTCRSASTTASAPTTPSLTLFFPSSSTKGRLEEATVPLVPPTLDDRTFDDLYAEARLRAARYNSGWTDFNESDPGVTLLQLFAWLTEQMLYRLNQVPERNY